MKVLVTGSRGYIGSAVVKLLTEQGHTAFGIDTNPRPEGSAIYGLYSEANINEEIIADIVVRDGYDTIFHLAASADVTDSVFNPQVYYENNVGNTATMLRHLIDKKWSGNFIFSSTAAVYEERNSKVYETSIKNSPNPYGKSKYACEDMLRAVHEANDINVVIFRYFNVAGAWDDVGDHLDASHIVSRMCNAVYHDKFFTLYGNNKMTKDKTCVRDYIHVRDVAEAHLAAARFLEECPGCYSFNLGTGQGVSNKEMLEAFKRFTGKHVKHIVGPDRPGDPDYLVAGADAFCNMTGYRYMHSSLESIVTSAWNYYCNKMEAK